MFDSMASTGRRHDREGVALAGRVGHTQEIWPLVFGHPT
jgi:hypothetical protein